MKWHSIRFTREEYESGELEVLVGAFRSAYVAGNGPAGMSLFGSWSDDGKFYLVYATPVSARYILPLLKAYSARQEESPPGIRTLAFLSGDEKGASILVC